MKNKLFRKVLVFGFIFLFLFLTFITVTFGYYIKNKNTEIVNILDKQFGVSWVKKFGLPSYADDFASVCQTSDGGYIMTGYSKSYSYDHYQDAFLVKIDKYGNEVWNKTFGESGGAKIDFGDSVHQAFDGGYVFSGTTFSYNVFESAIWFVKTDQNGSELLNKRYGDGNGDWCYSSQTTKDGGYILTGRTYNGSIFLLKIDKTGNELWTKKFYVADSLGGNSMCVDETFDGGYIAAGYFIDDGLGFLLKTDSNGSKEWDKTYSRADSTRFESVQQTSDKGFIICGSLIDLYGQHAWLVKTNEYGNETWNMTYNFPPGSSSHAYEVDHTKDGGYILTGRWGGSAYTGNSFIIKTNSYGNKEWQIDIEQSESSSKDLFSIQETSDDGYIIAGIDGWGSNQDGLLIKVDNFENQVPSPPIVMGPKIGIPYLPLKYTVISNDPDDKNLTYFFDWDINYHDPSSIPYTCWTEPFVGSSVSRSHAWMQRDIYHIRVKAMDEHYTQSDWTTFEVNLPRIRGLDNFNWMYLLERFQKFRDVIS